MSKFREKFHLAIKLNNWFPGHMTKGYREMQKTLRKVDCIIEVHDSRIPISGRNMQLVKSITATKPHILILTKTDLLDLRYKSSIIEKLQKTGTTDRIIFVDSTNSNNKTNGFSDILPSILPLVKNSERFNREDTQSFDLMIIGIPNVGKSTVINRMRSINLGVSGRPASVGAIPGVTRAVMERIKICSNPPVYLYDTPGVLEPKLDKGVEVTMKCALCATISDNAIGIRYIADYLLYWLNKRNNFSYVQFCGIDEPTDNIYQLLVKASIHWNFLTQIKDMETKELANRPQLDNTALHFVKAFRNGVFGRVFLDDDRIRLPSHLLN